MKKRIVFITDCIDIAYNELRGTILSHIKEANIEVEPVVPISPMSIINGNFILRLMAESYPEGTIFSVILNPSKVRPARLIGRTEKKDFYFMGANTGVFTWFFRDFGVAELYELHDPGFFPFGGKYVHAPAVAQIAMGRPLNKMGKPFNIKDVVKLDLPEGTIVHIDNFGLIKFLGTLPEDVGEGDRFQITINGKTFQAVYAKRMMNRETGEWVIYRGSSLNIPELGKVRENGASILKASIGDRVIIKKI